jgi:chromosome segregation protein
MLTAPAAEEGALSGGSNSSAITEKAENKQKSIETLTEIARRSVVVVSHYGRDGSEEGVGAGFVVSTNGLIATSLHVIGEARPITVRLAEGKRYEATEVYAWDRKLDLAIVRIEARHLPALPLGDSDLLKQGASVLAMGNPFGLEHSVVQGIVSGRRTFAASEMIQLAMPVEPGNSGGPLIDLQGRVQGILTLKSALTANLGFAMPINELKPLLAKPNPVPMQRWVNMGRLNSEEWTALLGGRWSQKTGRIQAEGFGSGFGGRSLCLYNKPIPELPFEVAVTVRLDDEAGAAGLVFAADGGQKHYGFYPSAGRLRLTRFNGPNPFSWTILEQVESADYRLGEWNTLKVQLEEEHFRLEARLREFAANVEAGKLNIQASRGTVEERQTRLRDIQQELNQAAQEQDVLLRQHAEKRSRLNILEQLQTAYEGFSAGTVAALKTAQGVLGSLTDKIRVPNEYITAIEAALGNQLQLILTEQPENAERIIASLNATKQGRASIAALSLRSADGSCARSGGMSGSESPRVSPDISHDPHDISEALASPAFEAAAEATGSSPSMEIRDVVEYVSRAPGVAALSVIEADASIQPLLSGLLAETRIIPDLSAATAAWRETNGGHDFVTLAGELLNRHGVYTGGYSNGNGAGKSAASVLGRKNQISELEATVAQLQQRVNEASKRKGTLQSEQTALQAGLQQAQSELRDQEVAIATHQGEFNALQNSLRALKQKIETVGYEAERLGAQEEEGMHKREALAGQSSEIESRERALQQQLVELNAGLDDLRQQRETANSGLTESKVAVAAEEQLFASFSQQQQASQYRLRELTQLLEHLRQQTASFVKRREQHLAENGESRARIESLQHDRDQINARLTEFSDQKQAQENAIGAREQELREERRRLTEIQQQRGGLEAELAQKNMSIQNLRQRVFEKYQVNLDDIRSECITIIDASEGGQPKVETLTPEEMAAIGASTDWNKVAEEVVALQSRVEEIGPVNLVAIEEYEETEQRHQFLTTQHDDLVQAKEQLVEVINRINTQTKEMFTETFNMIRENFRNLFVEIFGGGKADLILVNEGDVLESGIDIVARPPGKQLQSISLLSGGEQTMTAVALLFSIYQVKPSPFCVLDELDAPLDESNINRFIRVLQRFLEHSQFIIITHNKRTIGMADVLYGVTMQEHGVSRIVSVKFHKAHELVTDHAAAPLVPPPPAVTTVEEEEDKEQTKAETFDVMVTA